jgi:hypothetical protein
VSNFSLLINGHEYKNFLSRDTLATKITWPLNAPQKFEFGLADADIEHLFGGNGVPDIDSPIVLTTDGFGASTFKGFLSASPEFVLAGYKPTAPVYKYRCRATDQSYELNQMSARLAVLPDLSGRRSDEIIRIITEFLLPGKFTYDLSAGQYQPDFKIESTDLWSDVLKKLAEHDQFHWWVLADTIYYKQLGDSTLGASCDITTNPVITGWNLDKLSVNPRDNPIKNDIIVVGDTAPKGRGKLFAIGSGFEGNFPIQTPIWGFEDEIIANTDWKSQPDASTWEVSDPTSQLVTDAENLQFQGGAGIEQTYVRLLRAIELSGSLRLFHGEIQTTTPCDGVVGGLYKSFSSLALSNQLFGFLLSPNSGQTNISAAVRGSAVGTPVTTQNNHTYVLITRIYANQAFSHLTVYKSRNTGATYGGNNVLKSVHVTFEVWDYKIEAAAKLDPTVIRVWDQELDVSDLTSPFLAYAVLQLGTGADNHIAVSFTELAKPIQVILKTAKPVLTGYSSGDFTKYRAHGAVGSGTASITFVVEPGYNSVVGTINSTETVEIDTAGGTQLDVAVSGSWTGEVYFEVSSDGTNWSPYA